MNSKNLAGLYRDGNNALQMAGVLDNDGWQIRAIINRFKVDKKRPRVEVVLRETQGV